MDIDTLNEINDEAYHQMKGEREIKNRILDMSDSTKKQPVWNENFSPVTKADDSYLLGKIF